jgi:hypothetical protein
MRRDRELTACAARTVGSRARSVTMMAASALSAIHAASMPGTVL